MLWTAPRSISFRDEPDFHVMYNVYSVRQNLLFACAPDINNIIDDMASMT